MPLDKETIVQDMTVLEAKAIVQGDWEQFANLGGRSSLYYNIDGFIAPSERGVEIQQFLVNGDLSKTL